MFSDLNHTYCCMQVTSKSPVLSAGRLCCGEPSAHHPLCSGLSLHFKDVESKANLSPGFSVVYSDVIFRNSLRGFYALRAFSASLWCPSVLQGDVGEASCVLCPQHLWIIFCPSTLLPWKALRLTSLFSGCTDAVQGAVNLEGWISGTYLVHFKVVISNFCTDMLMQYE